MNRRNFITVFSGAAAVWPLAARARQAAMPVIGFLGSGTQESDTFRLTAIRRGLNEVGYAVGRNVAIEYRWAENQNVPPSFVGMGGVSFFERYAGRNMALKDRAAGRALLSAK